MRSEPTLFVQLALHKWTSIRHVFQIEENSHREPRWQIYLYIAIYVNVN